MKRFLLPLSAGLAHALLMLLAFPPIGAWPFAFFAIAPLVWIALRPGAFGWRDAIAVALGASGFYWYQAQWSIAISTAGYVPLVLYLTLYPGIVSLCLAFLHRRLPRVPLCLLVPIVWTGLEWLRGEIVWDGYAWFLIAHPLIENLFLSIPGSIVGAYGVGAFVVSFVGIAFDLRNQRRAGFSTPVHRTWSRRIALAGLPTCIVLAYIAMIATALSNVPPFAKGSPQIRVGIVQTNLPQSNKVAWTYEQRQSDFARFLALTRQAAAEKPSVILWPETMFPGTFLQPFEELDVRGKPLGKRMTNMAVELLRFQKDMGIPMLVGSIGTEGLRLVPDRDDARFSADRRFNSVFLLRDGAVDPARYDKIRLTPFGETMPYISAWPWLQENLLAIAASGMSFDLASGTLDRIGSFQFPPTTPSPLAKRPEAVRIVTPICFEITESSLCRQLVNRAAQGGHQVLIANITNDGWFGDFDPARVQHQIAARWRSLELGVAVVRAANTGISSVTEYGSPNNNRLINVNGRSSRVDGVMVEDVALFRGTTFFREYGDFCWVFPIALGGLLIVAFCRRSPNNPGAATGSSQSIGESS